MCFSDAFDQYRPSFVPFGQLCANRYCFIFTAARSADWFMFLAWLSRIPCEIFILEWYSYRHGSCLICWCGGKRQLIHTLNKEMSYEKQLCLIVSDTVAQWFQLGTISVTRSLRGSALL